MRTLVVGDVHGCRRELEDLLMDAHADRVILVGDLFTKGPDPLGVWELVCSRGLEAVLGNHDQRLLDVANGVRQGDTEAEGVISALGGRASPWFKWPQERPLFIEVADFCIVHAGLHPKSGKEGTSRAMALNMRRWPNEAASDAYWHDLYEGERGVIFGHDARRGLVRRCRGARPWLIGLDTGCVYGGKLSGYVIEADLLVQRDAHQVYRPV